MGCSAKELPGLGLGRSGGHSSPVSSCRVQFQDCFNVCFRLLSQFKQAWIVSIVHLDYLLRLFCPSEMQNCRIESIFHLNDLTSDEANAEGKGIVVKQRKLNS